MRYGLPAIGTMAHSYVLAFPSEQVAFATFMRDFPANAVMLVDTYDTIEGVGNAIAAARETGVPFAGVRLDSGDLLALARAARALLDAAGMPQARILASGDLDERRIAELVAAGAPIGRLGRRDRPRHQPRLARRQRRLQAGRRPPRRRVPAACRKRFSPQKATVPGAKQVLPP